MKAQSDGIDQESEKDDNAEDKMSNSQEEEKSVPDKGQQPQELHSLQYKKS